MKKEKCRPSLALTAKTAKNEALARGQTGAQTGLNIGSVREESTGNRLTGFYTRLLQALRLFVNVSTSKSLLE